MDYELTKSSVPAYTTSGTSTTRAAGRESAIRVELERFDALVANLMDEVTNLEMRIEDILVPTSPSEEGQTSEPRQVVSGIADALHDRNERLTAILRRVERLHAVIDL